MQKRIGRGLDDEPIAPAPHAQALQASDGRFRLTLRGPKGAEVVLAHQRRGGLRHGERIQGPVYPGGAPGPQARAGPTIENDVAVGARLGRIARVEVLRHRPGPCETDVARQLGVGAEHPGAQAPAGLSIEMRDLSTGVHAGIGAPGAHQADRRIRDVCERRFRPALHAGTLGLALPTGVGGSLVLQPNRDPGHQPGSDSNKRPASWRWASVPSCMTSSRMLRAPSGSPMSM